ncbi:MAG: cysteine--tRNA ligase, partial [Chlamydiia bacterium]|nr:cysteine--tRNA ligase [Chlamydiia bacterium]
MSIDSNPAFPKSPLYLYNSESRKKELFHPLADNHVHMYTCGPTVYHFAHIGNFRTYVFEDLLRRTLKFFGFRVTQVVNLTDVDDKTIRGAIETKQSLEAFTQPYKNAFFVDLQTLGIERVEHYPAATEYIPHMIDFIQGLLDKGVAYQSRDKSIYYAIEKCPTYGRLSHLAIDELKVGAGEPRVATDEYDKDNLADFVLWKAYDPERDGHIYWESPFGRGRPGWHLECSTMAMHLLGETLDIHAGAVDNIFPHHENEIA